MTRHGLLAAAAARQRLARRAPLLSSFTIQANRGSLRTSDKEVGVDESYHTVLGINVECIYIYYLCHINVDWFLI